MNTIEQTLSSFTLGAPQTHLKLAIFPLFAVRSATPSYRMLDEALALGEAKVTEITEGGSVPELFFVNDGLDPVLFVDGEELRGARQNRILNITILVGAGKKLVIPVSCVERGRWAYRKRDFESGDRVLFAKARAAKHAAVSRSMAREGVARSDQGRIWADIDERFAASERQSDTSAISDLHEAEESKLAGYGRAFEWQEGQAGAVFAVDGKPIAVEVFDAAETFRKFLKKAVGSFAMDAVTSRWPDAEEPSIEQVREFLSQVQVTALEQFPATGEGRDLRLVGTVIAGGALEVNDRVAHLSAFAIAADHERGRGRH